MKKKVVDRVVAGLLLLLLTTSNISSCLVYAEDSQISNDESLDKSDKEMV